MKKFAQCLMCKYVSGRTCNKTGYIIPDNIYNNDIVCDNFRSIAEENVEIEDSCCSESKRYQESLKNDV